MSANHRIAPAWTVPKGFTIPAVNGIRAVARSGETEHRENTPPFPPTGKLACGQSAVNHASPRSRAVTPEVLELIKAYKQELLAAIQSPLITRAVEILRERPSDVRAVVGKPQSNGRASAIDRSNPSVVARSSALRTSLRERTSSRTGEDMVIIDRRRQKRSPRRTQRTRREDKYMKIRSGWNAT